MRKFVLASLAVLILTAALFGGCAPGQDTSASAAPETTTVPTAAPTAAPSPTPTLKPYSFPRLRTDYRLDITDEGTAVIDRESGETTVVPFGEKMFFKGELKYSKDTDFIIHHVRAHAETYGPWDDTARLPVDYLRTSVNWTFDDKTPRQSLEDRFNCPYRYPDQKDKVITSYLCIAEFGATGKWDASFDPAWDLDGDAAIDEGAGPLPDYVDPSVFNAAWKNYVAKYWTQSWLEELKMKIDLAAAQHFDGIMMDVMTGYWSWLEVYPSMNIDELRQRYVKLISSISGYAKERYGTTFVITANLDPDVYKYFYDLNKYIDGGYYQNAFFRWEGSGIIDGYGRSVSKNGFENPAIDFIRSQGLSVLDMDHLGTGTVSPGLDFENYNDRITEEKLLLLFRWAIDSGSTPFVTQVFMDKPYRNGIPRVSRVLPGMPAFSDTHYTDWVLGSEAGDAIATGMGNDMIYGGGGNDEIDGGKGSDTAYYLGSRKDYEVVREGEKVIVTAKGSGEGKDVLISIERLMFSDATEEV